MNWIEDILQSNPDFKGIIEGASRNDVRRYSQTVGVAFPKEYEEFLFAFGKNDGGVLACVDGICGHRDISNLLKIHEELAGFPDDFPKPPWFLVSSGHAGRDLIMNAKTGEIWSSNEDVVALELMANSIVELINNQMALKSS